MKIAFITSVVALACATPSLYAGDGGSNFLLELPGIKLSGPAETSPGTCYRIGEYMYFNVLLYGSPVTTAGGQFAIDYDNMVLDFMEVQVGDAPFTYLPLVSANEAAGKVFFVSSVQPGGTGSNGDRRMATLKFQVIADDCNPANVQCSFDPAFAPILIADGNGTGASLPTINPAHVTIDSTPPVLVNVPASFSVPADAGAGCFASRTVTPPTVVETCGAAPLTKTRSDGLPLSAPYPCGATTITWSATNQCGLTATATTVVTVLPYHLLDVIVDYAGSGFAASMTRGITLRVGDFGVCDTFTFVYGSAVGQVQIPVGSYNCSTVDDDLRSLVSRADVVIAGTNYRVSATGANALRCGDINEDNLINVIDWGVMVVRIGSAAAVNTTCATTGFQCDFDGSGSVTNTDGNFIISQFLATGAGACGSSPLMAQSITRISVKELALISGTDASAADLNNDGFVDARDIQIWQNGGVRSKGGARK